MPTQIKTASIFSKRFFAPYGLFQKILYDKDIENNFCANMSVLLDILSGIIATKKKGGPIMELFFDSDISDRGARGAVETSIKDSYRIEEGKMRACLIYIWPIFPRMAGSKRWRSTCGGHHGFAAILRRLLEKKNGGGFLGLPMILESIPSHFRNGFMAARR